MDIRTPFINQYGRLRSGWRVIIFAFLLTVLLTTSDLLLFSTVRLVGFKIPGFVVALANRTFYLVSALIAGYFCIRFIEGLSWRAFGLSFHSRWLRDMVIGSIIGIFSLSLAVAICMAFGGLRFTLNSGSVLWAIARSVGGSAMLFVIAALAEEAIFRGYPLQTMGRAKLMWLGVLLTSVFFAVGHLLNPNVVPGFTFANTMLAGVWLAIAFIRTRSLWFPLGVHWAWNWALCSVYGLPVSGLKLVSNPLLQAKDLGPAWLTGGGYGIEGGAACTVALVLSSIFLWRTRLVTATPEQMKLTSEENPLDVR